MEVIMPILESMLPQAAGAIYGLALGEYNDKRQLDQQNKLMQQQIWGSQQMAHFNLERQKELWEATGYKAQIEQMKKAGLSPGLIYGMKGGGGQTAAAASGNVSGGQASQGGGGEFGLGLQAAMMSAQTEVMKSQARKNNVEAENLEEGGAGRNLLEGQLEAIYQGIGESEARTALLGVEKKIKDLQAQLDGMSIEHRLEYIKEQAREMTGKASQALIQANLDEDARKTRLGIIQREYVKIGLENILLESTNKLVKEQTNTTHSQGRLMEKNIEVLTNDILRDWDKLSNEQKNTIIREQLMLDDTEAANKLIDAIKGFVGGVIGGAATKALTPSPGATPVRGFHNRN